MSARINIDSAGNCSLGPAVLHPATGQLEAARAELEPMLDGVGEHDLVVVVGAGLGWHSLAAARKHAKVITYEPDVLQRAMRDALGPDLGHLPVAENINQLMETVAQQLVYGEKNRRVVLALPEAVRVARPELVAEVEQAVRTVKERAQIDGETGQLKALMWLDNLAQNYRWTLSKADPLKLAGRFAGRPAVVVGAGPSLDQSLQFMGSVSEKAMVLAAASALNPMAKAGITPHAALALEGKDESRQFCHPNIEQILLLAANTGHPNHLDRWPGAKSMFSLYPWSADLTGASGPLACGGHATSAAFSLAIAWGCNPVILVGQDLAFTNGKTHANGRPGGEDGAKPSPVTTKAINGDLTQTSAVMMSYINWYQESASYLLRKRPGLRIINATAEGAHLEGFEHIPLKQALDITQPGEVYSRVLLNALVSVGRPSPKELAQRLLACKTRVSRLRKALALDGPEQAVKMLKPGSPEAAMCPSDRPEKWGPRSERGLGILWQALDRMLEVVNA